MKAGFIRVFPECDFPTHDAKSGKKARYSLFDWQLRITIDLCSNCFRDFQVGTEE
jgi:hypothetical protein